MTKAKSTKDVIADPFLNALWSGTADPHLPITEAIAAQFLNLNIATLAHWRSRGFEPPAWSNLQPDPGKRPIIRYPAGELRKLIEQGMKRTKASPSPASTSSSTHTPTMPKPSDEQAAALQAVLEGAIPRGGPRKGVRQQSHSAFLATGRPDDEWVLVMVPSAYPEQTVRRPVDLITSLDMPLEKLLDAECEQMSLESYGEALAAFVRAEHAAIRKASAGDLPQPLEGAPVREGRPRP